MTTEEMQAAAAARGAYLFKSFMPLRGGSKWVVINHATGARLAGGNTPAQAYRRFLAGRIAAQADASSPFQGGAR